MFSNHQNAKISIYNVHNGIFPNLSGYAKMIWTSSLHVLQRGKGMTTCNTVRENHFCTGGVLFDHLKEGFWFMYVHNDMNRLLSVTRKVSLESWGVR